LNITLLSPTTGEHITLGILSFTSPQSPVFLNRNNVRGHGWVEDVFWTTKFPTIGIILPDPNGDTGSWSLEAVLDRSVLEVFINGGSQSATMTFYAEEPLEVLSVAMGGASTGVTVDVVVRALESAWAEMEGPDGIVRGNVTGNADMERREERKHARIAYAAEFE